MPNQQLTDYIKKMRESGYGDDGIKGMLQNVGHKEDDIRAAFDSGDGKNVVPPPLSPPLPPTNHNYQTNIPLSGAKGGDKSLFIFFGILVLILVLSVPSIYSFIKEKYISESFLKSEELSGADLNLMANNASSTSGPISDGEIDALVGSPIFVNALQGIFRENPDLRAASKESFKKTTSVQLTDEQFDDLISSDAFGKIFADTIKTNPDIRSKFSELLKQQK